MATRHLKWLLFAIYIGLIFCANWAVDRWGVVPVGLGLMAPAAVYVVGVTFVVRDVLQRVGGRRIAIVAIPIGAGLSAIVSPELALASGCAFLASETVDMVIYTTLERRLVIAVLVSGAVALVVDSVIFLWLAFGSLEFLPGQLWGKFLATLAGAGVILAYGLLARRPQNSLAG